MNGIQCFYYHCFWLNTDFSNSFFVSPPTSPQWIVADEHFHQRRNRTQCVSIEIAYVYFNYSEFTSSYELFSQALKSFDYVLSGSKRKIAGKRKMQTKQLLKWCTRNVHPSFADFRPGLGVNFHILLTQNWLWESSLSLLSLWCILFRIKLGLFRENVNLKKYLQPKNGWSSPSTFWHRLIYHSYQ